MENEEFNMKKEEIDMEILNFTLPNDCATAP
jgi:hypothetical protein